MRPTTPTQGERLFWLQDAIRLLAQDGRELAGRAPLECRSGPARWTATHRSSTGHDPHRQRAAPATPTSSDLGPFAKQAWHRSAAGSEDGQPSIDRIVEISGRPSQGCTPPNLAPRTIRHDSTLRSHDMDVGDPRHFGPDDPRSGRFSSGGQRGQSSYIRAVTEERTHVSRAAPVQQADE